MDGSVERARKSLKGSSVSGFERILGSKSIGHDTDAQPSI
jgi:hypothetical protein